MPHPVPTPALRTSWLALALAMGLISLVNLVHSAPAAEAGSTPPSPLYETREPHHRDGIGKFFMDREIAHVMGHQAADWLERPERESEEETTRMIGLLGLKPGDVVVDMGCGTGYLTRKLAPKVGPRGRVLAVDIQPEMLDLLTNRLTAVGITNVTPVLGGEKDPHLPAGSADLILMVDVYHEFSHPYEMTAAMCRGLKTGGLLVFVEFRKEDPKVPIKEHHKMSEAQVKREMAPHPLEWVRTESGLPWQHVIFFRRK